MHADSVVSSFYGGDVGPLRIDGSDERILVRSRGKPFIRAKEYNAWLGTYPLNITSGNPSEARKQALEQMVAFKLMVRKARQSGYERKLSSAGVDPDEKSLAISYIRDQIASFPTVTDEQARDYERRNPALLPEADSPDMPPEVRKIAVKGSARGEQLWNEIKTWMKQAGITYEGKLN